MARKIFTLEEKASILVSCQFLGDLAAIADRWQITVRTIHRWQKELETDPDLEREYLRRLGSDRSSLASGTWVDATATTLKLVVEKIASALVDEDQSFAELGKMASVLGEIMITQSVLFSGSFESDKQDSAITETSR